MKLTTLWEACSKPEANQKRTTGSIREFSTHETWSVPLCVSLLVASRLFIFLPPVSASLCCLSKYQRPSPKLFYNKFSLEVPPLPTYLPSSPSTINYCSSNIKLLILLLFFYLKAIILLCSQESIIFSFVLSLQFMPIFLIVSITEYLKLLIDKPLPYLRLLPMVI